MTLPVVLLYHVIAPVPETARPQERRLFVNPLAFERQMNYLARHGIRTMRLAEYAAVVAGAQAPRRSVLLTFDDAYAHVDAVVSPILRRLGFTAVMFASWSALGRMNSWDGPPSLSQLAIATPEQLRVMSTGPWEIASHGLHHVDLRLLSARRRLGDLIAAREAFSQLVKAPVVDLAYPYGRDNPEVQADVRRAGYRMAFAAGHTRSPHPLHLSRRPITAFDSMASFQLKTTTWLGSLYRLHGLAPSWTRLAARGFLGLGS